MIESVPVEYYRDTPDRLVYDHSYVSRVLKQRDRLIWLLAKQGVCFHESDRSLDMAPCAKKGPPLEPTVEEQCFACIKNWVENEDE